MCFLYAAATTTKVSSRITCGASHPGPHRQLAVLLEFNDSCGKCSLSLPDCVGQHSTSGHLLRTECKLHCRGKACTKHTTCSHISTAYNSCAEQPANSPLRTWPTAGCHSTCRCLYCWHHRRSHSQQTAVTVAVQQLSASPVG